MTITTSTLAPRVVIIGITGNQGGSVARALMESEKEYRITGVTRDPTKPVAKEWEAKGVEVVQGSICVEEGNGERLQEIAEGADYFFAVTDIHEHFSFDRELAEGKLMVDAALAGGVKLFIWSGLESYGKVSGGKYAALDFFKAKDEVTEYLKASGMPWAVVVAGSYASNFIGDGVAAPQKQPDGSYHLVVPSPPEILHPVIDTKRDFGSYVRAIIEVPGLSPGCEVFTGKLMTCVEMVDGLAKATGKKVTIAQGPKEFYESGPALGFWCMWNSIHEFGFAGNKDIEASQKAAGIVPRTWDEILATWDGPLLKDLDE